MAITHCGLYVNERIRIYVVTNLPKTIFKLVDVTTNTNCSITQDRVMLGIQFINDLYIINHNTWRIDL